MKRAGLRLLVVSTGLLALLLVLAWSAGRPPSAPAVSVSAATAVARNVAGVLRGETPDVLPDLSAVDAAAVFAYADRKFWFRGDGPTAADAVRRLLALARTFAATNSGFRPADIVVSFVGESKELLGGGLLFWSLTMQQGLDGISMKNAAGRREWLLPEEAAADDWAGGEPFGFIPFRFGLSRQQIGAGLARALATPPVAFGRLPRIVPERTGTKTEVTLERFRSSTFYFNAALPETAAQPLYRNTVLADGVPRAASVTNAMRLAGDWFLRHQLGDGAFTYRYEPFTAQTNRGDYSMPRHAGSLLALYRIYRHTGERKYLDGAERALAWLEKTVRPAPRGRVITESGSVKLGTVAITALALFERRAIVDTARDPLLVDLLEFIAWMRKADGTFCHFFFPPSSRDESSVGQNFSGQALWALAKGIRAFGRWTGDFAAGMNRQACGFWNFFLSRYYMFPFSWEMQAVAEAGSFTPAPRFAVWRDFLLDCGDSMVDFLYDSDWPFPDYRGGYGAPEWFVPLAHAAGFQCEGLTAAYHVARVTGDTARTATYRRALRDTAAFLLSQQVSRATAQFYRDPAMSVGAFRAGPADHRQQIDFTQHVIASLLNMLDEGVFDGGN